jgi:hypothetical protein
MLTCCTVTLAAMGWDWPGHLDPLRRCGADQILLMFLINLRWKISGHAAAMRQLHHAVVRTHGHGCTAFVLAMPLMIGPAAPARHTLAQTIAGTLLGITLFLVARISSFRKATCE